MTFCDLSFDGFGTTCARCGCWSRGNQTPECPPWVTRSEPDNARLPHIKTAAQNKAVMDDWLDKEWAKDRAAMGEAMRLLVSKEG